MPKLKIGVFGGARGFVMIKQLLHHPDAELVAVCDKYTPLLDKVRKAAEEAGVNVALYESFDRFIEHDMDAVVLANYAPEHGIFAVKCLKAGKHVMSEVLPAETPAQMVELVETVESTGKIYAYAENYCYMKAPFEMWRKYSSGEIGTVQYCEGEYIHDCSAIWPEITYGQRDHWRNRMFPTFYCTHSCGPMITITGQRPVRVTGFETNLNLEEKQMAIGCPLKCAVEMIQFENGAIGRSVHGGLKREPVSYSCRIYGTRGCMESALFGDDEFNIYREGDQVCKGDWQHYAPVNDIGADISSKADGHGGSDFYPIHCFIQKILGRPEGKWSIDVYTACDMGLCGIMGWRSVLAGNAPMDIPNFRLKEDRDAFRNDNACCTPSVAGDQLLPRSSKDWPDIPDETFENVRKQWLGEPNPIDHLFPKKEEKK